MRAASARADVGGIGFRDSERSNIVHPLALISSEPLSIERGSKRTHVPMRNDGMRPALELLASQRTTFATWSLRAWRPHMCCV